MPTPTELAQAAYKAYGDHTGGLTYDGRPMPAWDDLGPTVQAAWTAAAASPAATQTQHPWRATARTIAAAILTLLTVLPAALAAIGPVALPWAAGALAVVGGITRVLAVPAVNDWLSDFLPFLAAKPRE